MKSVDRNVFILFRSQARSRAHQRPRLWKEYKRRRRARPGGRFTMPVWLGRLLWPLILVISLPGIVGRVGTEPLLAMLALYCSGTALLRAAVLRNRLYRSNELFLALHYPVSDREFFRWQVREWLVSIFPVFVLSAMSYVCVAVYGRAGSAHLTQALLGGLAQTVIVITLSLSQEFWLTRIWAQPALALYALIAAIFVFPRGLGSLGGKALAFLPATWVNLWLASSEIGGRGVVLMLLFLGLLAALDVWIVRSLEEGYPRSELTLIVEDTFQEEAADAETASPSTAASQTVFGRDYAVAHERFAAARNRSVVERQLAEPDFDWNAGHWTTRVSGRWLTPRQRLIAEFLSANSLDQSKYQAKRAVQLAAAGVVLCAIPISVPLWLPLSAFVMAGFMGLPLSGAAWPGLRPWQFGFARLQPIAGYPIGYVEASVSTMKVNAVRVLGFTPTALIAGFLTGWRYFGQPTTGLLISGQILLMLVVVQPYSSLLLHSAGTNDTKRLTWTSTVLACGLIGNAVLFVPAAVAFFTFNRSLLSWILGPIVLALLSLSMWRFYGFLYSRHQIDLISAGT